jgi:hypothetical protein
MGVYDLQITKSKRTKTDRINPIRKLIYLGKMLKYFIILNGPQILNGKHPVPVCLLRVDHGTMHGLQRGNG